MSRSLLAHDDRATSARITRVHARTFHLASRLLPEEKRRAAYAIYAFCRIADDAVDLGDATIGARDLAAHRAALDTMYAGAAPSSVFRELAWATERYDIPRALYVELLDGVARDLTPPAYADWRALAEYCEGVAASVGEICARIFGVAAHEFAIATGYARTLGVAMQLTNILRDVGEDRARGRCYLPDASLRRVGLTRDDVLAHRIRATDPRWISLMQSEIERARTLYRAARPGIALLAPDARGCAVACADGYAAILGAIERAGYDSLTQRSRVSTLERATLLWRSWRATEPSHAPTTPVAISWRGATVPSAAEMGDA
ncbi:MAG: phytoene/squalene synthase family protein [Gemmatimonadaceae bacterium]|nr:phytoene/squalene synthase family protein [Gemmatimonadaceae bacterium]